MNRVKSGRVEFGLSMVCALLLTLLALPTFALQVQGLYEAEVPVAGQSAEQRAAAISEAFVEVLIKVTGNRNIGSRPEVEAQKTNAPRYVQQYRYRLVDVNSSEVSGEAAGETPEGDQVEPSRMLQVIFDRAAVDRVVRDAGLPVWGGNRPGGLIWLGIEQNGQRLLLSPESEWASVSESVSLGAERRGIPVLFPLMDLEDQNNLRVADLWGDFETNIRYASQRYTPDLIVTGKLIQVARGHWRSNWQLYHGAQVDSWQEQAGSVNALAESAIHRVADMLAERFAPVAAENDMNQVRVRIESVSDLGAHSRLALFLRSLSSVDKAHLVTVETDSVVYDLLTRGSTLALQQGLDMGGMMVQTQAEPGQPEVSDSSQAEQGIDLFYRLR